MNKDRQEKLKHGKRETCVGMEKDTEATSDGEEEGSGTVISVRVADVRIEGLRSESTTSPPLSLSVTAFFRMQYNDK